MPNRHLVPFIESQFPNFYQQEGSRFIKFVEAYYEWLEDEDNKSNINNNNLLDNFDIDRSIDQFLVHFQRKYLDGVPISNREGYRFLIKHSLDLFKSKGSQRSIELAMKLLFNVDAEVSLPSERILKSSDSQYIIPQYLEVSGTRESINLLNGKEVRGSITGAKGFVEGIITKTVAQKSISIVYLNQVQGNFITNELVVPTDTNTVLNAPKIIGSLTSIEITLGGANNNIGDIFEVHSKDGRQALVRITGVESATGRILFTLIDGGTGYTITDDTQVLISNPTVQITKKYVQEFNVSGVTGTFQIGGMVIGENSKSTATIHRIPESNKLTLSNISGSFEIGEKLIGPSISNSDNAESTLDSYGPIERDFIQFETIVQNNIELSHSDLRILTGAVGDQRYSNSDTQLEKGDIIEGVYVNDIIDASNPVDPIVTSQKFGKTIFIKDISHTIEFIGQTANFPNSGTLQQLTTGSTATILSADNANNRIKVRNISGNFIRGETITSGSGSAIFNSITIDEFNTNEKIHQGSTRNADVLQANSSQILIRNYVLPDNDEFKPSKTSRPRISQGDISANVVISSFTNDQNKPLARGRIVDVDYSSLTILTTEGNFELCNRVQIPTRVLHVKNETPDGIPINSDHFKIGDTIEQLGEATTQIAGHKNIYSDIHSDTWAIDDTIITKETMELDAYMADNSIRDATVKNISNNVVYVELSPGRGLNDNTLINPDNDTIVIANDIVSSTGIIKKPVESNSTHISLHLNPWRGQFSNNAQIFTQTDVNTRATIEMTGANENEIVNESNNDISATIDGNVNNVYANGEIIAQNTSFIGLFSNTHPLYQEEILGEQIGKIDGISSGVSTNTVIIHQGSDGDFKPSTLTDEETISIFTDVISSNNISDVNYQNILINGLGSASLFVSGFTVQNGGAGYSNNDVVVTNGGDPNTPARGRIVTNGSGVIQSVTLLNSGNGFKYSPDPVTITTSGGSGAQITSDVIRGYGFPKSPTLGYNDVISSVLSSKRLTVGTIASIGSINPGIGYTINPFVVIRNNIISPFNRKDFIMNYDTLNGNLQQGEELQQNIPVAGYKLDIDLLGYNLNLSNPTAAFNVGGTIKGIDSDSTATIRDDFALTNSTIRINESGITGDFNIGEIIYESSGAGNVLTTGRLSFEKQTYDTGNISFIKPIEITYDNLQHGNIFAIGTEVTVDDGVGVATVLESNSSVLVIYNSTIIFSQDDITLTSTDDTITTSVDVVSTKQGNDQIQRSIGNWTTDGVAKGDIIFISNSTNETNNGRFVINSSNASHLKIDNYFNFIAGNESDISIKGPDLIRRTTGNWNSDGINPEDYIFIEMADVGDVNRLYQVYNRISATLIECDSDNIPNNITNDPTAKCTIRTTATLKNIPNNFIIGETIKSDNNKISEIVEINNNEIKVRAATGDYAVNNKITGDISGAYANVVMADFNNEVFIINSKGIFKSINMDLNEIYVKRTSLNTIFQSGISVIGSTSGTTFTPTFVSQDENSPVYGDNAEIFANAQSIDGVASNVEVIQSGYGYIDDGKVTLVNVAEDDREYIIEGISKVFNQGKQQGFWRDTFSQISDPNQRIYDGHYYQEYSYVIKSELPVETYRNIIQKLFEISGTIMFGEVVIPNDVPVSTNIAYGFVGTGQKYLMNFDTIPDIDNLFENSYSIHGSDSDSYAQIINVIPEKNEIIVQQVPELHGVIIGTWNINDKLYKTAFDSTNPENNIPIGYVLKHDNTNQKITYIPTPNNIFEVGDTVHNESGNSFVITDINLLDINFKSDFYLSGTFQSFDETTKVYTISSDSTLSRTAGEYNDKILYIKNGPGAGQARKIENYSFVNPNGIITLETLYTIPTDKNINDLINNSIEWEIISRPIKDMENSDKFISQHNNSESMTILVSANGHSESIPAGVFNYQEPVHVVNLIFSDLPKEIMEGTSSQYGIKLSEGPAANVGITITSNNSDITIDNAELTFTPTNWNIKQNITIIAARDSDTNNDNVTLTYTLTGDEEYQALTPVNVIIKIIIDDDDN